MTRGIEIATYVQRIYFAGSINVQQAVAHAFHLGYFGLGAAL